MALTPPGLTVAKCRRAFTLIELLLVVSILLTLAAIAIPSLLSSLESARIARAASDLRTLETEIGGYEAFHGYLPNTLDDIGRGSLLDPWGNPYRYLNFATAGPGVRGMMRKDQFLVPINSTYDLYTMGRDGQSKPPLTAQVSHDDVIRASDGGYLGLASQY